MSVCVARCASAGRGISCWKTAEIKTKESGSRLATLDPSGSRSGNKDCSARRKLSARSPRTMSIPR